MLHVIAHTYDITLLVSSPLPRPLPCLIVLLIIIIITITATKIYKRYNYYHTLIVIHLSIYTPRDCYTALFMPYTLRQYYTVFLYRYA